MATLKATCTVDIKFVTSISLWDALKLRLAGGEVIKEMIEKRINEIKTNDVLQTEKPNVPKPQGPLSRVYNF